MQKFYLSGVWLVDASDATTGLDKLVFQCYVSGALVFNEEFPCTKTPEDSTALAVNDDLGNCYKPGAVGTVWKSDFGFEVPPTTPKGW